VTFQRLVNAGSKAASSKAKPAGGRADDGADAGAATVAAAASDAKEALRAADEAADALAWIGRVLSFTVTMLTECEIVTESSDSSGGGGDDAAPSDGDDRAAPMFTSAPASISRVTMGTGVGDATAAPKTRGGRRGRKDKAAGGAKKAKKDKASQGQCTQLAYDRALRRHHSPVLRAVATRVLTRTPALATIAARLGYELSERRAAAGAAAAPPSARETRAARAAAVEARRQFDRDARKWVEAAKPALRKLDEFLRRRKLPAL